MFLIGPNPLPYGSLEQNRKRSSGVKAKHIRRRCSSLSAQLLSGVPGGEDLRRSDVCHHVQEVIAHEDSSLQQQEGEADAVPDYPGLVFGELTEVSLGWSVKQNQIYSQKQTAFSSNL